MSDVIVEARELSWAYRAGNLILDNITFEVGEGEIVGVIGPNGCGKTTLLQIIAGLLSSGENGKLEGFYKCDLPIKDSHLGFVFQNYQESLLPWRTVYGNIKAGRELLCTANGRPFTRNDNEIVLQRMNELGLGAVQNNFPFEISGGQAQLTSLARALAIDAHLLILDEPTSSLHYNVRNMVLDILLSERSMSETSILFSSHSIEDASILGDRILILNSFPTTINAIEASSLGTDRRTRDLGTPDYLKLYRKLIARTAGKAIAHDSQQAIFI